MFNRGKTINTEQATTKTSEQHFRKLCQLCSPNSSKEEVLTDEIDWLVIWKLALRHRVVPVMADRIKQLDIEVPNDVATLIADNVQQNLYKGMRQAAEIVRLTKLFNEHNIPFVMFKGIGLLKLMGLELHQRHHGDIDILLADVDDLWKVDELLTKMMGYSIDRPKNLNGFNRPQKIHFLSYDKDVGYFHNQKGINLELHFKILPSNEMLPFSSKEIFLSRDEIDLNNIKIPVMSVDKHQLYLLLHGAISRWYRLKWLCDIPLISNNGRTYLLDGSSSFEYSYSHQRMVSLGLFMANTHLSMPLNEHVKKQLKSSKKTIFLAQASTYFLDNEKVLGEMRPKSIFKIFTYYSYLLRYKLTLMPRWAYKKDIIQQYSTDENDWRDVSLPECFFVIYYLLRPFLWLKRQF